jgi:hypothetical protein
MCALLHMTATTGGNSHHVEIDRKKETEFKTKGYLLHAIDGAGRRRWTGDVSSSDADGGNGEESSDDDNGFGHSKGVGKKHRSHLPAVSRNLPPSLMSALTIPPPLPLSMASEEFIRDFLSKYPPAPKSYEVIFVVV